MVEAVSGLDLETYMQRHIFAPLGMTDTSYNQRPEWDDRLTAMHARQADGTLEPMPAAAGSEPNGSSSPAAAACSPPRRITCASCRR